MGLYHAHPFVLTPFHSDFSCVRISLITATDCCDGQEGSERSGLMLPVSDVITL